MRNKLLKDISAAQFALTELGLYLDTHPCDQKAIAAAAEMEQKRDELVKLFEEKFGPLTVGIDESGADFSWICDPWPWEKEAN